MTTTTISFLRLCRIIMEDNANVKSVSTFDNTQKGYKIRSNQMKRPSDNKSRKNGKGRSRVNYKTGQSTVNYNRRK